MGYESVTKENRSGRVRADKAVAHRLRRLRAETMKLAMGGDEPKPAASVDCGWGRLIFAQTFDQPADLVDMLRKDGIDIARRTVAKYRESMHIPSSVQRRREKRALADVEA